MAAKIKRPRFNILVHSAKVNISFEKTNTIWIFLCLCKIGTNNMTKILSFFHPVNPATGFALTLEMVFRAAQELTYPNKSTLVGLVGTFETLLQTVGNLLDR